jgi:hypothetical protein
MDDGEGLDLAASELGKTLCERCRLLDLEKYWLGYADSSPAEDVAVVPVDSIRSDCALCVNFTKLFEYCTIEDDSEVCQARLGESLNVEHALSSTSETLKIAIHRLLDEHYGTRTCILVEYYRYGHSQRKVLLVPLHVRLRRRRPFDTGRRIIRDLAEINRVEEWIGNCQTHHTLKCCATTSIRPTSMLRIIDCKTRMVRLAEPGEPYVCLSYVWGSSIARPLGLDGRLPVDVPKTIKDAMLVAEQLHVPQLWVDQYCIDQKDIHMKASAIKDMNLIYGGAHLTIIAASGIDASSGLPGICGNLRKQQQTVRIGSMKFLVSDTYYQVRKSKWNSRGWTYQEGLLSCRRLVFTKTQLYFQCSTSHHLEELSCECMNRDISLGDEGIQFFPFVTGSLPADSLRQAYHRIKEYFPRSLSYGSDSLSAIEGVLNDICSDSQGFLSNLINRFYGIPFHFNHHQTYTIKSFLTGLTWGPEQTARCDQGLPSERHCNSMFPSWTWASHKEQHPHAGKLCMRGHEPYTDPMGITVRVSHLNVGDINLGDVNCRKASPFFFQ